MYTMAFSSPQSLNTIPLCRLPSSTAQIHSYDSEKIGIPKDDVRLARFLDHVKKFSMQLSDYKNSESAVQDNIDPALTFFRDYIKGRFINKVNKAAITKRN